MNKSDLIIALTEKTDTPINTSETIVNTIFNTMKESLIAGDGIEIRGFGSWVVKEYKGHIGKNPKTGEPVVVKPKKRPFFKTGKGLQEKLNTL